MLEIVVTFQYQLFGVIISASTLAIVIGPFLFVMPTFWENSVPLECLCHQQLIYTFFVECPKASWIRYEKVNNVIVSICLLCSDLLLSACRYLVDCHWFKQWKKYVGFDSWDLLQSVDPNLYPGPIDNSGILDGLLHHLIPLILFDKLVILVFFVC